VPVTPRILAFAGSAREGSYNKKLVPIAAAGARAAGAEVTEVDLRDFPMPLFDADMEKSQGMPEPARRFKSLMTQHDGFLIASPEYNSGITPLLKNTIDWASRAEGGVKSQAFTGKAAVLMSASPGSLGGLRALVMVRAILTHLGVLVLPAQRAVSNAGSAFEENGSLKDEQVQGQIEGLGRSLAEMLIKLRA
jgi:NAD(P)H-dependent FMN reductase